jgi:hypothetical protein
LLREDLFTQFEKITEHLPHIYTVACVSNQ